jgi:hypothetical protein
MVEDCVAAQETGLTASDYRGSGKKSPVSSRQGQQQGLRNGLIFRRFARDKKLFLNRC